MAKTKVHSFTPNSTSINEVRYNPAKEQLYIEFNTGTVYRYEGVSLSRYVWFRSADSAGTFFAERIKPNYVSAKVPTGFPKALAVTAS